MCWFRDHAWTLAVGAIAVFVAIQAVPYGHQERRPDMIMRMDIVVLAALGIFATGFVSGRTVGPLKEQTRANLLKAMHGEAFAHAKYLLFAEHARTSGHTDIADLFERTAHTERLEHLAE